MKVFSGIVAVVLTLTSFFSSIASAQTGTVAIKYKGRSYLGQALAWDGKEALLMRRDGRMSVIPADNESDFRDVSDDFKPLSRQQVSEKLRKEFGSKYQVSITPSFVVVHPKGSYARWAGPFETLYQRFRAYFSTRGLMLDKPEFPMVAVVLRTRNEFDKFLKLYHQYDPNILGYYSPRSNRVITYDQSGSNGGNNWLLNAGTIVHEAAHQTAFNTGMHSRTSDVPSWVSEGMATLFEAPGVNNCLQFSDRMDRINDDRFRSLRRFYRENQVEKNFTELITSDRLFRSDPQLAYAMAWGLTFYLSETKSRKYFDYLRTVADRGDFADYGSADRTRDFVKFFGKDLKKFSSQMKLYFSELPTPVR